MAGQARFAGAVGGWLRAALLCAALSGCEEAKAPEPLVTARYEPSRAGKHVPLTEAPPLAYKDDIPTLANAGGEVIGSLELKGEHGATEVALNAEAQKVASLRGGTHVLFVRFAEYERTSVDGEANERAQAGRAIADAGAAIGCGMGNRQACVQHALAPLRPPPATAYKTETVRLAVYLVLRVPQERWPDMPAALRPTSASRPLSSEPRLGAGSEPLA